jgi:general secretion pathway protein C
MMFLELLKKYFWVTKLIFVALLGSLLAMLTNTRIDAKLGSVESVKMEDVKAKPQQEYTAVSEYKPILQKNLFNSEYVYFDEALAGGKKAPEDYQLLGTMAWDPAWSMAIIQSRSSGKTSVYREDDKLDGDTTVQTIERKRVTLLRSGQQLFLDLPEIKVASSRISAPIADGKVGDGKIKQTGDGEFVVDNAVLEQLFSNPMALIGSARIMPHFEKGGIAGLQVSKVKPSGLAAKIGMQDGDIIRRVNGTEIKGVDDVLKLMGGLKGSKSINMDLTRGGKRTSLNYSIR